MTLTIELDFAFGFCAVIGAALLILSVLRGLGVVRLGNPVWLGASPLALALNGVSLFLIPVLTDISHSGHDWLAAICFLAFAGLVVSSLVLELRARADLPPNQSLQQTLDPAGSLPGGRAPSASSAAEHRRYVTRP